MNILSITTRRIILCLYRNVRGHGDEIGEIQYPSPTPTTRTITQFLALLDFPYVYRICLVPRFYFKWVLENKRIISFLVSNSKLKLK